MIIFYILFLFAAALFIASLTVFPVIVGVKSGRIRDGFIFFGFTAAMYMVIFITALLLFITGMFLRFYEIWGAAFLLVVLGVLYAVLVFVITYKLVLKKILFDRKENLVLGVVYSVAVSFVETVFYIFLFGVSQI